MKFRRIPPIPGRFHLFALFLLAAALRFPATLMAREASGALSVPLLVLQRAAMLSAPCPTNLPVNTLILTQVVSTPGFVTNIDTLPRTTTNIACTNLALTNVVTTNFLVLEVVPTNIFTTTITVSNFTVTNIVVAPVTVTNLAPTNSVLVVVEPFLDCRTNVGFTNVFVTNVVFTNLVFTNFVMTNVLTEEVVPTQTNFTVLQRTNIVFVDRGVTNVFEFDVPVFLFTNVLVTNVVVTPVDIPVVVSNELFFTNIVVDTFPVTNVVCDSGFITNQIPTNWFVIDVFTTNLVTTNIFPGTVLVTNTSVLTVFLTNAVPTNLFLTNIVTTNVCTTNLLPVLDLVTNVFPTNRVSTNFVTTNITPAGVRFSAAMFQAREPDGDAVIGIERIGDTNAAVEVTFSTSDVTASAGSDYTATTRTIRFPPGLGRVDVRVPLLDDTLPETNEVLRLTLSGPVNAVLLAPCVAELAILDDDTNADLVLGKSSALPVLKLGETNEWMLTLRNDGPATATNIVVGDRLPGGFPAHYSRPSPGTTWSDDFQEWRIPSLAPGATSSLVLGFRWISEGPVTNCAAIERASPADPNTNNNVACAVAVWRNSTNDVSVVKRALVANTNVGGVIPFRITVRNNGPEEARPVNVNDRIPAGAVLVRADTPPGTIRSPGTPGAFTLPVLTNGESADITVYLRCDTNAVLTNCVSAHGPSSDVDRDTSNNDSCAAATWGPSADLEVFWETDAENPAAIAVGTDANWRVVLTNKGPDIVTNATVRIAYPDLFRRTFSGPDGRPAVVNSEFDPATRTWRLLSTLVPGNSAILRLGLMATNSGAADLVAEVMTSDLPDPDSTPGNGVQSEDDFSRLSFPVLTNHAVCGRIEFCDSQENDGFRPTVRIRAMQGTNVAAETMAFSGNGVHRPYCLTNLPPGTYTIAADAPGYTISIAGNPVTVGPGRANPNDFRILAEIPFFLAQVITCGGRPLPEGVTVNVSGPTNFVVAVGPDGTAVVTNVSKGSEYTLTPSHPWLAFDPPAVRRRPGGDFSCRTELRFTGCPTITVGGRLLGCGTNPPGIPLVPITLATATNIVATNVTAAPDGRFAFTNVWPGPYRLTATGTNLVTLAPPHVNVTVGTAPLLTNLTASVARFVSGRVTENTNIGPALTNLAVVLSGPGGLLRTNFTDTNGFFVFTNLDSGRYVVRPFTNNPAFRFAPSNAVVFLGGVTNCTNFQHFIAQVKRAELVSLEVMQVVQGWTNPVTLVARKPTFVRAHLQPYATNIEPVLIENAKLLVKKAGVTLARINPNPGRVLARTNAALQRTNLNSSLNFPIDDVWTRLRGVSFEFQWTNGVLSPREPAGGGDPASNAVVSVDFQLAPTLPVRWLAVEFTNHLRIPIPFTTNFLTLVVTNRPDVATFPTYQREVLSLYPVSRMTNRQANYRWVTNAPSLADIASNRVPWAKTVALWQQLVALRGADAAPLAQYIGIVAGGAGLPFFRNAGGNGVATFQEVGPEDARRHETGHELGHALGRPHPIRTGAVPDATGNLNGVCGETSGNPPVDFFPMHPIDVMGAMVNRPTLGPVAPDMPEGWIMGWYEDRRRLVNPFETFELMSYCRGVTAWKWTSQFTYERLFTAIRAAYGVPILPFNLTKSSGDSPSVLVSGSIDTATGETRFGPAYVFPETRSAGFPDPGPYRLRMIGAAGIPIMELPFAVTTPPFESESGETPPPEISVGHFGFRVPFDPTTTALQIVRDGQILAERTASPAPPVVGFVAPAAGGVIGTEPVRLAWTRTDGDGDALASLLQWSPDGGANWETLAMDLPDAEFDVSSDSLRGSTNALFRVLVTDGLRTSVAVAGPVTVRGHLPTVAILMPTGGMQYAAGDQIEFLGRAFDLDEGDLDDDSVVWTSDLAGEIGRGARFSVPAEDLPAGRHRIAAVATDSSGNTATNSVEITVGATRSPLLKLRREDGTLVFSWSRLDEGFGLEVTAGTLPAAGGTPDPDALIPAETSDDEEFVVRLPEPGSTRFYRLRRIDE